MTMWLIETLASGAALMALVLALRLPVARWFGPRTAYALWLLPLLRTLLPPLPGWHTLYAPTLVVSLPARATPGRFVLGLVDPALPGSHFALPALAPLPGPTPPAPPPFDIALAAAAIWLAGALLLLGWQWLHYRRFMAVALAGASPIGEAAGTRILLSDGVAGPMAAGIVRRRILLPRDFARRYGVGAQRLVLDHEAAHHDRGDLLANLAALLVLALHWWNPIAWIAHRAFRADQEIACDASVLARVDRAERYIYAEAVARSAGFATPATVSALSPVRLLKRRLRMMGRTRAGRARTALGAMLATCVIGAGLLASASGNASDPMPRAAPRPPVPPEPGISPIPPIPPMPPISAIAETPERPEIPETPEAPTAPELQSAPSDRAIAAAAEAGIRTALAERRAEFADRRAQEAARRAMAAIDVAAMVRASLTQARAGLAASCAARGRAMPAHTDDWGALATCGGHVVPDEVRQSLVQARADLAADRALAATSRDHAVAALDQEIARLSEVRRAQ